MFGHSLRQEKALEGSLTQGVLAFLLDLVSLSPTCAVLPTAAQSSVRGLLAAEAQTAGGSVLASLMVIAVCASNYTEVMSTCTCNCVSTPM